MDLPLAYIPIDRRLAIAQGVDLADRCQGTVLFADISGFTPLTETLARELGPKRGADELTKQLDTIYDALIAQVERFRGSVIGFAGDAITCWFDSDDGLRAIATALAMQQAMRNFATLQTPGGTAIPIAVKVVVASGSSRRFRVGDPHIQYLDTLAGAILDQIALLEHQTDKGEVVVAAEIASRLAGKLEVRVPGVSQGGEWRNDQGAGAASVVRLTVPVPEDPWPPLPPGALTDEMVRPWVLPSVYERFSASEGRFIAEIRPAVPLFMKFGGIDYDHDEMAGEKLDEFVRRVQNVLAHYDGALLELEIGDKGSVLYGAFGAPVAHDDDPLRAVAASMELRALPSELGYITSVQIGITQGRTRAGPYGGPTRRSYGVHGDQVNLAARLMSKANPGEVLVTGRIAQAVGSRYELRELGLISVKGKSEQVAVSLVLGPSSILDFGLAILDQAVLESRIRNPKTKIVNPLVGREPQLEQIAEVLDTAISGAGQILRIEGPAGVGKSHLSAELIRRAEQLGVRVATAACQSTSEGIAYFPWRQVFRSLLELPDDGGQAIEERIMQRNPDWLLRLPLLGDLLGVPIPDNATTAAFDPKLRQSALFDLLGDMLRSWAQERPLLILVDDIHWMDVASQELAVVLGRIIGDAPVLMTLVSRPPFSGEQILPGLEPLGWHRRLNLDELSDEAVAVLVAARLGCPVSDLALALIQSVAEGNPFFVEEVVDSLRESGSLRLMQEWTLSQPMIDALRDSGSVRWVDGHWELTPNASLTEVNLGLPDSVEGVVLSRIDRLPEVPKLTLRVASVIGHAFAFDLLAPTHPMHPADEELSDQIGTLEARGFTHLETPQPRPVHIFKHNVTHDVAYETLLHEQRTRLHRAVGEALESLAPDDVERLAYHTFAGEDWSRSLGYQKQAGQQAKRIFANHEAIEHFKKARFSAEQLPDEETVAERQQIDLGLGELLTSTGQYDSAIEQLQKALALGEKLGDKDGQALACRWIARAYENRGEFPQALEWIQKGLDILGEKETAAAAELLSIAGLIYSRQGNHDFALQRCQDSLRMAEKLGERTVMALGYNLLGHITRLRGNRTEAIEHFQMALSLYEQAENAGGQAISHNQIANVYFDLGRWPEADTHYRLAREIFNRIGDVYNLIFVNNNLGGIALNQGRLDDALAFYQDALRSLEQIGGSPYVIGALYMNLGATFARRGEIEAAEEHLDKSRGCFEQAQARDFLPEMHRHLAEAALLAGRLDKAKSEGGVALALARELAMRGEEGSSLRVLGEIAEKGGDASLAESRLAESLTILQEVGDEYEAARTELALAALFLSQRRVEEGTAALERSMATLQRLQAEGDLAIAAALTR